MKVFTDDSKKSQYDNAGWVSKLFFSWVTKIFIKSFNRPLSEEELFNISQYDSTAHLTKRFQNEWNHEQKKKNPSLIKSVCRVFWKKYLLLGIVLFVENVINLAQPILIWKILSLTKTIEKSLKETLIYSTILIITVIVVVIMRNPYFFYTLKMGMQLKVGICGMLYQKVLRLNQKALGQTTTGQIINLLSNDVQRFELSLPHLHYIWCGPFVTIATIIILYFFSGKSGIAAIFIFLILVPIQIGLGKLYSKLRFLVAVITDERIKMVSELINGMRVVKMYCWEPMFIKIIDQLRRSELKYVLGNRMALSSQFSQMIFQTKLAMCVMMTVSYISNTGLNSAIVFSILSLLNILRNLYTRYIPYCVSNLQELRVTIHRIQNFLSLSEYKTQNYLSSNWPLTSERQTPGNNPAPFITFENVFANWNDDILKHHTLHDISFHLESPQICAIIGEIGSGKSSLFMAILGELPINSGNINSNGKISYASQQPWVFSGTILQNILFNRSKEKQEYLNILNATTLQQDIKQMASGELTHVGERGVYLSGGQKARVSLARAAYYSSNIILLDDPLAAVDTSVGVRIFFDCISGLFKNKLVLLITHQLHLLKSVDKIIVLNEGNLVAFGTYDEIVSQGINLNLILKTESQTNEVDKLVRKITKDSYDTGAISEELDYISNINNYSRTITHEEEIPLLFSLQTDEHEKTSTVSVISRNKKEDVLEQYSKENIKYSLYWKYLTSACPGILVILMFTFYMGTMFLYIFCDIWLSWWTQEMDKRNITIQNFYKDDKSYLIGFIVLSLSNFVGGLLSVICLFVICVHSGRVLHQKMLRSILFSPVSFFDENSAGKILNRFSKDMSIIDDLLPVTLQDFILTGSLVIFGLGLAFYKNYWSGVIIIPLIILFWALRKSYINVSCSVKRIEAVTRSPLFGHVSTTLQGLTTIRALKSQNWFIEDFNRKLDRNSKAFFLYICTSRWFAFRLDEICSVFIMVVIYSCVILLYQKKINSSDFGLLLTYVIGLIGLTQWSVRQSTEVENQMISVERVYDYISLPPERPSIVKTTDTALLNWPRSGKIQFENVSLYYEKSGPYVLQNIDLVIEDKEKIGIVGRTGSGKSSLISLLFRLVEIPDGCGRVVIDNEDISGIGLQTLRTSISVIPQDPVLFMGTIRINLDPFNEFDDVDLWGVLETVELKETIGQFNGQLNSKVSEGGSNLSVGQRQLICMARALLKKARIIVIDEATANVDPHTDNLIQTTLKTTFAHCTVLTIAHRLNTIMDSDKIIVMNDGTVEEFDHPHILFTERPSAMFSQMVQQSGPVEEEKLKRIAYLNFLNKEKKL